VSRARQRDKQTVFFVVSGWGYTMTMLKGKKKKKKQKKNTILLSMYPSLSKRRGKVNKKAKNNRGHL
jgi:hypothetical protein